MTLTAHGKAGRAFHRQCMHIEVDCASHVRCDHTSTNAPDPIRTPQLSVLGHESSTRMGDLLRSPRVAPLLAFSCRRCCSLWVRRLENGDLEGSGVLFRHYNIMLKNKSKFCFSSIKWKTIETQGTRHFSENRSSQTACGSLRRMDLEKLSEIDILCAWIGRTSQKLWRPEALVTSFFYYYRLEGCI